MWLYNSYADILASLSYLIFSCAVDVQHWWSFSRRLPFPRPADRSLRSCQHVPVLPWQERRGEVLILVDGFEKQSNLSHSACAQLDFAPARAMEAPKVVLTI